MAKKKKASKPKFTNRDAGLIDDIRKAFVKTVVSLPNGAFFDGSNLASQAGFEKAVSQVVLKRTVY
jgi:hypothetical protein